MSGRARLRRVAVGVATALAVALGAAPAVAADPAAVALAQGDAYVSPRVLGTAASAEQAVLAERAAALRAERRPVKLAVVLGPVGAPSLQAYTRRLAQELGFEGTLLVTRRGGGVASVGPRSTAEMTVRLREARVGAIANPAERLATAAGVVAVPLPDVNGSSWRPAATLLLLGLLGGGWAVAMGAGRAGRRERRDLAERRARARVRLDALRAHAIGLAGFPGLPDDERRHVQAALGGYADIVAQAAEARTPDAVEALDARIDEGLDTLAGVASRVGAPHPRGDIFAGLCAVDPGHGGGTADGVVDGRPGARVCPACQEAAATGRRLSSRMVPAGAGAVPFAAVGEDPQEGGGPVR